MPKSCEGFGLLPFRSPLLRKYIFASFPPGTEMFHFPGCARALPASYKLSSVKLKVNAFCIHFITLYFLLYKLRAKPAMRVCRIGFPHSEISGSKVATHLPEAYRSYATSFIASYSQGIHRTPLNFLLRNLKTTIHTLHMEKTGSKKLQLGTAPHF